jgi:hypothetical protein
MMAKTTQLFLICVTILLLFSGCGLHRGGRGPDVNLDTRTYIDSPLSETEWQARRPIAITVHANFFVSRILVDIDKVPSDPDFHDVLEEGIEEITPGIYQANLYWTPPAEGKYRLAAYSYTGRRLNGYESWTTHSIILNVVNEVGGGAEPTPTPLPTAPAAGSATNPWIDLWADQYSLTLGSCTTLRWDALHVDQLLLNGEAVAFTGSRQICPVSTSAYTLRGISTDGTPEVSFVINVSAPSAPAEPATPEPAAPAPADTTGPNLGGLQLSTAKVFDNASCGPDNITVTTLVQDTGGVSKIELHYHARTNSESGAWRVKNMTAGSGGNYYATLGIADFTASLLNFTPGRVDVLVKAWDSSGNVSQSVQMSFETDYCLF